MSDHHHDGDHNETSHSSGDHHSPVAKSGSSPVDSLMRFIKDIAASPFVVITFKYFQFYFLLLITLIFIVRGSEEVNRIFDLYFKSFFSDLISTQFKGVIDDLKDSPSLFMVGLYSKLFSAFIDNLIEQPNPLLKILMIGKALLVLLLAMGIIYQVFYQSIKYRNVSVILMIIKLYVIFVFVSIGSFHVIKSIDSSSFWDLGQMFVRDVFKDAFLKHKLVNILVFMVGVFDIFRFNIRKTSAAVNAAAHDADHGHH